VRFLVLHLKIKVLKEKTLLEANPKGHSSYTKLILLGLAVKINKMAPEQNNFFVKICSCDFKYLIMHICFKFVFLNFVQKKLPFCGKLLLYNLIEIIHITPRGELFIFIHIAHIHFHDLLI
jgi:hypothetical protein